MKFYFDPGRIISAFIVLAALSCFSVSPNALGQTIPTGAQVYLPLISDQHPPNSPVLTSIDNADQDNLYTVSWQSVDFADSYILEEATDPSFSNVLSVYNGTDFLSWSVMAPGKTPQIYYYRVRAKNSFGESVQSNVQSVIIYPLFIGLTLRWDGTGYIRFSDENYDVGVHVERRLDALSDIGIIRSNNQQSYDPNPKGWALDNWYSFYSISTGEWRSSSEAGDPAWKWNYNWLLPYNQHFSNGQTVLIDEQAFIVSGPQTGVTAFGKTVQYWELVNRDKFLFYDGNDWKQYVNHGDIKLRYDAGNTRLILYSDILRTSYYKGKRTSDTVEYIENLTSVGSFPSAERNLGHQLYLQDKTSIANELIMGMHRSQLLNSLEPHPQR